MPHGVLCAMKGGAARVAPLETGGVLMGYSVGRSDIVVTRSIGPGPRAVHGKTRFIPDHDFQEVAIAASYSASGRRHGYLGDWHSHPNGDVELSRQDRHAPRTIAAAPDARMPFPIMAVLGGPTTSDLGIWQYVGYLRAMRIAGRAIAKCAVHLYDNTERGQRHSEPTHV